MSYVSGTVANFASSSTVNVAIPSGSAANHIAVVGLFTGRGSDIPAVTPPDVNWQVGPATTFVSGRGELQTFYKRLTAAESGTWEFDFSLATNGCQAVAGLWSGRLTSASPIGISLQTIQDRVTQTGLTGTAALHDDVVFIFNDWNGVAETVTGFTKGVEDSLTGAHLFYANDVAAGSITGLPSPASSANTYWYTMLSLKVDDGSSPPASNGFYVARSGAFVAATIKSASAGSWV